MFASEDSRFMGKCADGLSCTGGYKTIISCTNKNMNLTTQSQK